MALTDALSVAMKALGMGADVYFEKGMRLETKYEAVPDTAKPDALKAIAFSKDLAELTAIYNGLPKALQADEDVINEAKNRKSQLK
jgi:hypothetical protein